MEKMMTYENLTEISKKNLLKISRRGLQKLIEEVVRAKAKKNNLKVVDAKNLKKRLEKDLSKELCFVKRYASVEVADEKEFYGCHLPDTDLLAYSSIDLMPKAIFFTRGSLKTRIVKAKYWREKLYYSYFREIKIYILDLDKEMIFSEVK